MILYILEDIITKFLLVYFLIYFYENLISPSLELLKGPTIELETVLENPSFSCKEIESADSENFFRSPEKAVISGLIRIRNRGCFKNLNLFNLHLHNLCKEKHMKAFENIMFPYMKEHYVIMIPVAFHYCSSYSFHKCIHFLMKYDPEISFRGQNYYHMAAYNENSNFDPFIYGMQNILYLHIRDDDGFNPIEYISDPNVLNLFRKRYDRIESHDTLYPLEIQESFKFAEILIEHEKSTEKSFLRSATSASKSKASIQICIDRYYVITSATKALASNPAWFDSYNDFSFNLSGYLGYDFITYSDSKAAFAHIVDKFFAPTSDNENEAPLFVPLGPNSDYYVPSNLYDESVYKLAGSFLALVFKNWSEIKIKLFPSIYRSICGIEPFRPDDLDIITSAFSFKLNIKHQTESADNARVKLLMDPYERSVRAMVEGFKSKLGQPVTNFVCPNFLGKALTYPHKKNKAPKITSSLGKLGNEFEHILRCEDFGAIDTRIFAHIYSSNLKRNFVALKTSGYFKTKDRLLLAIKNAFIFGVFDSLSKSFYSLTREKYPELLSELLNLSVMFSKYDLVRLIISEYPDISFEGRNILHLAAQRNDHHIVPSVLSDKVSYLESKDNNGKIPLDYVRSYDMVNILKRRYSEAERKKCVYPLEMLFLLNRLEAKLLNRFADVSLIVKIKFKAGSVLELERGHIFDSTVNHIVNRDYEYWFSSLLNVFFIKFKNENGVDENGLTNEWLNLLVEEIFSEKQALFIPHLETPDILCPSGNQSAQIYEIVGSILALAVAKGISLRVELIPSFYRRLLHIEPYKVEDFPKYFPGIYKNLNLLCDSGSKGDAVRESLDLKLENVPGYIEETIKYYMYGQYSVAIDAMCQGFRKKLLNSAGMRDEGIEKLVVNYNPEELRDIMKGRVNTKYEDFVPLLKFYPEDSSCSDVFKTVLSQLDSKQLSKFLKFVTGYSFIPLDTSNFTITVEFESDAKTENFLPQSETCFKTIHIYDCKDVQILKSRLIYAIENCETFEDC